MLRNREFDLRQNILPPRTSSMGLGMGRTGMASRSLRDRDAMEKAAGLRPAPRWGRKAPDPISWHIAYKTQHNLGSYHFFTYVVHAVSENHFKLGTWAVSIHEQGKICSHRQ